MLRKYYVLVLPLFLITAIVFYYSFIVQKEAQIKEGLAASSQGDADGDGLVNFTDFQILSNTFGKLQGQAGYDARADFNPDNAINFSDFQILSNNFGK